MVTATRAMKEAAARDAVASGAPLDDTLYAEYVRGFDDVPVLHDVLRAPPPRPTPPSFVRGERRSLRREERPDAYDLREARLAEIEQLYREHADPQPAAAPAGGKRKKRAAKSNGGRKRKRAPRAR